MRLVLLNGNTSTAITDLIVRAARAVAQPQTETIGVTARFGAPYIAARATYAIAGHAVLDAYAAHGREADAVVLACFGDPGIAALREVTSVPVVGMAEAACRVAAARHRRFAIVTGGTRWVAMLEEYVSLLGLADQLAGIHAVAPSGAEIAADPEGNIALLAEACRKAAQQDRADVVVLGGAGLAGLAPRVAAAASVPLVDGLEAAVREAEAAVAHKVRRVGALESIATTGVSQELATLLNGPPRKAGEG